MLSNWKRIKQMGKVMMKSLADKVTVWGLPLVKTISRPHCTFLTIIEKRERVLIGILRKGRVE